MGDSWCLYRCKSFHHDPSIEEGRVFGHEIIGPRSLTDEDADSHGGLYLIFEVGTKYIGVIESLIQTDDRYLLWVIPVIANF